MPVRERDSVVGLRPIRQMADAVCTSAELRTPAQLKARSSPVARWANLASVESTASGERMQRRDDLQQIDLVTSAAGGRQLKTP